VGVSVIGGGFSGISASCFLAAGGCQVDLFERHEQLGGRCRVLKAEGFSFDMGPSWYWMPDVFEQFFGSFGKHPSDYYDLVQLDPAFQLVFKGDSFSVPASAVEIEQLFEQIEPGSAGKLRKFLEDGAQKYAVGVGQLVYRPSHSWTEFLQPSLMVQAIQLRLFRSMRSHVSAYFKDERLRMLMEFPVLFLGAMADRIPALYSLMNYAAFAKGTWYPVGGMGEIVKGMEKLARSLGVEVKTGVTMEHIHVKNGMATALKANGQTFHTEGVIASGDYHHMEQRLLPEAYRNYSEAYWQKRVFAPSCLLFYLGVSRKIDKLQHHNLFFDASFDAHGRAIYEQPSWPDDPLFYVCCPSKTDKSVAPEGMENLFVLVPVAAGLAETEEIKQQYLDKVITRMEQFSGTSFKDQIIYTKSYCVQDFEKDYFAYKGNAYGLANVLLQTAFLKPAMRNKKVQNLFYAGQLTVPGPGVPPALISGQVAAGELLKQMKR